MKRPKGWFIFKTQFGEEITVKLRSIIALSKSSGIEWDEDVKENKVVNYYYIYVNEQLSWSLDKEVFDQIQRFLYQLPETN